MSDIDGGLDRRVEDNERKEEMTEKGVMMVEDIDDKRWG